jgi:signal transduction histidine kinase
LQALLRVRDDGEGMPAPVLARATEPMFTTKPDSAGWGLSLLAGFVRQSGGQTRIASSPGLGTQVEIWLPIVDLNPARDAASGP